MTVGISLLYLFSTKSVEQVMGSMEKCIYDYGNQALLWFIVAKNWN
jgi:hypothetical protein